MFRHATNFSQSFSIGNHHSELFQVIFECFSPPNLLGFDYGLILGVLNRIFSVSILICSVRDPSRRWPLFQPPLGEFRTFFTTKLVSIWLWVDFRRFQSNIMRFHPHLLRFEIILLVISFSLYVCNCLYFFICNYNFYLRLFFFLVFLAYFFF